MKFLVLIYNDHTLLDAVTVPEFNAAMRECFSHADELKAKGTLIDSQQLELPATAKTVRIRNGKKTIVDGPYAEAKEMLGGFNLIEAENMEEALKIADMFPWASTGCIEVRPVRDVAMVRERVAE